MRLLARLALVALLTPLGACDPPAPGEVVLALSWPDRPASAISLSIQVEERAPGAAPRLLARSARTPVAAGAPIDLAVPAVPNGGHRVVVVEAFARPDDEFATYGGVSAPFSVTAGRTVVGVTLVVRPVASPAVERQVELCFDGRCGLDRALPAQLERAEVRVVTRGIGSVRVANDPSFSGAAAERFEVAGEHCTAEGEAARCAIPWSLTAGIDSVEGGRHLVYVRFRDTRGFELPPEPPIAVIRDGSAPLVFDASLTPDVVRPGEPVRLVLDASEVLDVEASRVIAPDANASSLTRVGDTLRYSAVITPAAEARAVAVGVELVDPLGNRAAPVDVTPAVAVDADPPAFTVHAIEPAQLGAGDEATEIVVRFEVVEAHPLDEPPGVSVGEQDAVVSVEEPGRYVARLAAPGQVFAGRQGVANVEVRWTDRAGNAARQTLGPVAFDFLPPRATGCAVLPTLAGIGQPVTYQIIASEPLASARLAAPVEGFPDAATLAGELATWSSPAGAHGPMRLAAILVDAAGHEARDVCPLVGERDLAPIDLSAGVGVSVWRGEVETTPFAAGDAVIRVEVEPPEAPRQISVLLEGEPLAEVAPGRFEGSPRAGGFDRTLPIRITVEDAAGNISQRDEVVLLDRTLPTVNTNRLSWAERPAFIATQGNTAAFAPAGSVVTLIVRADEPVEARALVGERAPIALGAPEAGVMRVEIQAPEVEQVEAVRLELTDRAGNRALLDTGTITWDFTAPDPPAGALRLVRAPWGAEQTDGEARTFVEQPPGGVGPFGTTIEIVRATEDGRCQPGARVMIENTDTPGRLLAGVPGDLRDACVVVYDRAGNPSVPARLRQGAWIATLGGEIPGDDLANPHQLVATPWLDQWRLADRGTPAGPAAARQDGAVVEATGAWTWWRMGSAAAPGPSGHLVVDPHRGRLMVLDSTDDGVLTPWILRLAERAWSAAPPSPAAPADRFGAWVAYDPGRDRLLLMGGAIGEVVRDTWAWSAQSQRWQPLAQRICGVGVRGAHDPARDTLVLHGGVCAEGGQGTLVWDLGTDRLTGPQGEQPSMRAGHAMAWDAADNVVLLYGGFDVFEILPPRADLWAWDGAAWALWEADAAPGGLINHAMAWDRARSRLVLHGPLEMDAPCRAVWERTAGPEGAWIQRPVQPPCPTDGPMTWVEAEGRIVARDASGLWRWEGEAGRWQQMAPTFAERPTAGWAEIYADPDADRLTLVDEQRAAFTVRESASTWAPSEVFPAGADVAWSPAFGSITQVADGAFLRRAGPGDWAPLGADGDPPGGECELVTRGAQDLLCLGDVDDRMGIWRLSEAGWRALDLTGEGPAAASLTAGAWLQAAGQLVVVGSANAPQGFVGQMWLWSAAEGWQAQPEGPGNPTPRVAARLAWVQARARLALFGGYLPVPRVAGEPRPYLDDLWEWDGVEWTEAPRSSPWPSAREQPGFGYDARRRRLLLFGGRDDGGALNDFWEGALADGRPALRLDVRLGAAGIPLEAIEQLTIDAVAGGAPGEYANGWVEGARLQAWIGEDWLQQAANDAPPDAPAPLRWATADLALLSRLPVGSDQTVSVTVTPRGLNGEGIARVTLDAVEARIDYRLPE